MLKIRALKEGFRRAGKAFSKTFTEFQDDTFTENQLAALVAEPMIVIEHIPEAPVDQTQADLAQEDQVPGDQEQEDPPQPDPPAETPDAPEDQTREETTGSEATDPEAGTGPTIEQLKAAAAKAVEDGSTTKAGIPTVEAMEEILGFQISSAQRDQGYDAFKQETKA